MLKSLKDAVSKLDKESLTQVLESVKETGAAARTLLTQEKVTEQFEKLGVAPLSKVTALEARVSQLETELEAIRQELRDSRSSQA